MTSGCKAVTLLVTSAVIASCAATYEQATRRDLVEASQTLAAPDETVPAPEDGAVPGYVAYAMTRSPELRAAYERWQAATLRISRARALPEPMISYAYYAAPVQTRVGPQRHRVSARQDFPWPTRLTAAADAMSARAAASQRRFEARALALAARVASAWWRLWYVRRAREVEREQLEILDGLSQTSRARLEIGEATLADLSQVDLTRSRVDDLLAGLREEEISAEAALRAALGAPRAMPVPTAEDVPPVALPAAEAEELARVVREHPYIASFALMAEAEEAQAAALEADRLPRFSVGVDWIETGSAAMEVQGSGDDAVVLNFGLSVPLWQEAYDEAQRAALADAAAERAEGRGAEDAALAELEQALAAVRDSYRRVRLYRDTLLPQAQTAYESVIGAYVVGRSTVASSLLAQRDLLEISLGLARARADHGEAWARLQRVVGRPVEAAQAREPDAD